MMILSFIRRMGTYFAFLLAMGAFMFGGLTGVAQARETFSSGTLSPAYVGVPSSYYLAVIPSSAPGPYTWTWAPIGSSTLPPGFTVDASGTDYAAYLHGGATLPGFYTFTVRGVDSLGRVYTGDFGLTAYAPSDSVLPQTIQTAYVGSPVNQVFSLAAPSGTIVPAIRWQFYGNIPPGLSTDMVAGTLFGTPTVAGTYSFVVAGTALDGTSQFGVRGYAMTVSGNSMEPVAIHPGMPFSVGTVGQTYPVSFLSALGGTGSYSWTVSSGSLPPGLTLNSNGSLSGVPLIAGTYAFVVQVRDSIGATAIGGYVITINPSTMYPIYPTYPDIIYDVSRDQRIAYLQGIGVAIHELVKLPDDGISATQEDSAVYYIGKDGRRHAFPNSRVFSSWYTSFVNVRIVSPSSLAGIPLGMNVTYKPGVRMVKFQTNPRVYVVGPGRALRWVTSATTASALYGSAWNRQIDDVSDAFYANYQLGEDVVGAYQFDPISTQNNVLYPSDTM